MFALQLLNQVVIPSVIKQASTIIFLHGLGDTGQSWADILPMVRPSHAKVICPNAPVQCIALNGGVAMPAWFDLRPLDQPKDEFGIKCAAEAIQDVIEKEVDATGISPSNIVLGGFSQGGALALYTGLTLPFQLGGILALSTWLPLDKVIPWGDKKVQTPPILICHGDEDEMIALSRAEKTEQTLRNGVGGQGGNKDVQFKVYPGLGHTVACEQELQDIHTWLARVLQRNKDAKSGSGQDNHDKNVISKL